MSRLRLLLRARVGSAPPAPSAPLNTAPPVVSGSTVVGATLTCSTGMWTNSPTSYGYQWLAGASPISGATASTFELTATELGAEITCAVTATNAAGSVSETSEAVGPITEPGEWPATLTLRMGSLTRKGFGGKTLGYDGAGYLGITAGDTTRFQIDAYNRFCPNGAGAYGTSNAGLSASSYSLTITEYSDSGKTTPTGATQALTVEIDAGDYDVIAHPTDISTSNQLRITLLLALVTPCTVWGDGHFNSDSALWRFRPAGNWTGGSRVTVRSRVVDTSLDEYGHQNKAHGFTIGNLTIESNTIGNAEVKLDFVDCYFYCSNPSVDPGQGGSSSVALFGYNTAAYGVGFYNCGFASDPTFTHPRVIGIDANFPTTVDDCVFKHIEDAIKNGGSSTNGLSSGLVSTNNIFYDLNGDAHSGGSASDILVEDNLYFKPRYTSPEYHADFYQGTIASSASNIVIRGNYISYGAGASGNGALQAFANLTGAEVGTRYSGIVIEHNIALMGNIHGIQIYGADGSVVRYNTILADTLSAMDPPSWVSIEMNGANPEDACVDATLVNNIADAISLASLTGTVTNTNNLSFSKSLTRFQTSFPTYSSATSFAATSRSAIAAIFTPANVLVSADGTKNADGTYSGALGPDGQRNTGGTYP